MGNTIYVEPREDAEKLEITQQLIRDFQYHINLVDRSMLSLARSIDSMRASCAVFQKTQKEDSDMDDGDGRNPPGGPEVALLLETIDEVISDHKFIAVESLSRFFTFIIGIGTGYFTSDTETTLSVERYRLHNCANADINAQYRYCDARMESLRKKIKALSTDYQTSQKYVQEFNRREELYLKEKLILKTMNENLETEFKKMKEDLETESNEIKVELKESLNAKNSVEQTNNELRHEIQRLRSNAEQMKKEITFERSSKFETEKKSKAGMDECMQKIWTFEENEKDRITTIEELQKEIDSLNEILSKEREAVASLREAKESSVTKLNEDINRLNAEFTDLKSLQERDIRTLKESLERERTAKEETYQELIHLKDTKRQSDEEKESITLKASELESEIKSLIADVSKKQTELDSFKENRKAEIETLKESLAQEQTAREETNQELNHLKDTKRRSDEEKEAITMRACDLESKINSLTADVSKQQEELKSLEENQKAKMDSMLTMNEKLRKDLKAKHTKLEEMKSKMEFLQETNAITRSDLSKEKEINISLREERLSNLMSQSNDQINNLKESLMKETHSLRDFFEKEIKRREEKQSAEKELLEMQLNSLKLEHQALMTDIRNKQKEIDTLKEDKSSEMERSHQKIEKLKKKTKEQTDMIENLKRKNNIDFTSNTEKNADTSLYLIEEKEAVIRTLEGNIEQISMEVAELKISDETERNAKNDCLKQLKILSEKQNHSDQIIKELIAEKKRFTKDAEEQQKQIKSLEIRLEISSRKVIYVQICYQSGFHASKAMEELQTILKTRMAPERIDLQFLNCSESFIVMSDRPLLIVCSRNFNYDRQKNIAFAVKGLKDTQKKTALIFFQEREVRSIHRELAGSKAVAEKLCGIFDIGYKKDRIYESDTNSSNIKDITDFIKREGVQQSIDLESTV